MLPLLKSDYKPSKCYATYGRFPIFVDPKQTPQNKKPWNAISTLKWCSKADIILPAELIEVVQRELEDLSRTPFGGQVRYAKVVMSLLDIVSGEFFDIYIKRGNVMMLMMHNAGVDYVFELHEGLLRLEIDKPTYETLGLPGKPIADGGLKHKKTRYAIELNLRLPSMLHGKKGFERVVAAFKNVTGIQKTFEWLFYDCAPNVVGNAVAPIEKHNPVWITSDAQRHYIDNVRIPDMVSTALRSSFYDGEPDDTYIAEIGEWISLVSLQAPRVQAHDKIDAFLCRYSTPEPDSLKGSENTEKDMAILRWHGFLPPTFIVGLLLRVMSVGGNSFAALQVHGFQGNAITVVKLSGTPGAESNFLCLELPRHI